jgi:acyl carrier protein
MAETVEDRINRILINHLGTDPEKLTPEASLLDDLGADSLDLVELTMAAEEEFGIKVSDNDAADVNTVGDFYALVKRLA